jgi:hypothetical protein
MADGGLKLELGADLSDRLRVAAETAGRPVADYAAELIEGALDDDWAEDDARFAEYQRTGISVPAEEALSRFREAVARRFTSRK